MDKVFWTDKPVKLTISNKSINNTGIPKVDLTGQHGIICGPTLTSTVVGTDRNVSNNAAGNAANSISTQFYLSCAYDFADLVLNNADIGNNRPGSGIATGDIDVRVWWDSRLKGDSSDDTSVQYTLNDITVMNAVEKVKITGLSFKNGGAIPYSNGTYTCDAIDAVGGIYVNYQLSGEYHQPSGGPVGINDRAYMPIYNSETLINIVTNSYSGSFTYIPVPVGTVGQTTINASYLIPAQYNESSSSEFDYFIAGIHDITVNAMGSYSHPSDSVQLTVKAIYQKLEVISFTFSDSSIDASGVPSIKFNVPNNEVRVVYSWHYPDDTNGTIDGDTGELSLDDLSTFYVKSLYREPIGTVTATCYYGSQVVEASVNIYMRPAIINYLRFYNDGGTNTIHTIHIEDPTGTPHKFYYSLDGRNIYEMQTNGTNVYSFTDEMYVWGENANFSSSGSYIQFAVDGDYNFRIDGNIMGLLSGENNITTLPSAYCFCRLFMGNILLESITNLEFPASVLTDSCYLSMFENCTNLTDLPGQLQTSTTKLHMNCYMQMFKGCSSIVAVPSDFLASGPGTFIEKCCYEGMFQNCTSLTSAPELPNLSVGIYSYRYMFQGCTSLTTAPNLPATKTAIGSYQNMFTNCTKLVNVQSTFPCTNLGIGTYFNMFYGCTSLDTEITIASASTTLPTNCCNSMFWGCTNLTIAPILPAKTLGDGCYGHMFRGCTSLNTPPNLPATTLAKECYQCMFYNCTGLESPPALPATTLAPWCYAYMFVHCTKIKSTPTLAARTLVEGCYSRMFYNCSALNNVTMLCTGGISSTDCLTAWLHAVASTGTFTKASAMTSLPTGVSSGIPSGWTVVNKAV